MSDCHRQTGSVARWRRRGGLGAGLGSQVASWHRRYRSRGDAGKSWGQQTQTSQLEGRSDPVQPCRAREH